MDLVGWLDVAILLSLLQCIEGTGTEPNIFCVHNNKFRNLQANIHEDLPSNGPMQSSWRCCDGCRCTTDTIKCDTCSGAAGQSEWPVLFHECGGSSQSPINVDTSETRYDPSLPEIRPLGYEQYGREPFTLSNDGHTVMILLPSWMGLAGLPWQFSALQLHLHWGNGVSLATGSEHTVDEQSASAELHVVHYNSALYSNVTGAKTRENGLAVLAVLIEAGEETNQAYANILNYLNRIRYAGQSTLIPAFDVRTLLPKDLSRYFRYSGSLTTPPCHQSVMWTVFDEKVKVSFAQLLKLETVLYSDSAERNPLQDNYRTIQPLNNRTVLSSFVPVSANIYTAGKISAIVTGGLCGCVGLALILHFIIKAIRTKDTARDVALRTTSDAGTNEEATPQSKP